MADLEAHRHQGVWGSKSPSRGHPVRCEQSAETLLSINGVSRSLGRARARIRRPELEATVRPLFVVMGHVLSENNLEVAAPQDQHPVEALAPAASDPALSVGVGARCHEGRQGRPFRLRP